MSFYVLQDFISQWSLGQEAGSEETSGSPMGLAWLIPLWVDRDAEVRLSQSMPLILTRLRELVVNTFYLPTDTLSYFHLILACCCFFS